MIKSFSPNPKLGFIHVYKINSCEVRNPFHPSKIMPQISLGFQLPPASEEADWQQGASFYHEEKERTRGLSAGCHYYSLFPGCQVDKLDALQDTCFIRFDFSKVARHTFFHLQAVCHFLERNLSPHLTAFLDLGQVLLNIFYHFMPFLVGM